jgi:uncharacterized protein
MSASRHGADNATERAAARGGAVRRRSRQAALRVCLGRPRLTAFCDSSAVVNFYADEPDAAYVRSLPAMVVSALVRVEVPAAIWRKQRAGLLAFDAAADLAQAFEADWLETSFAVLRLRLTDDILSSAGRLVARHQLRTLDAIHLASALAARAADSSITDFACFGAALAAAARAEGLTVVP